MNNFSLEEVINDNKNLIYNICYKYSNKNEIEDLYQVGVIGLIKAYNNFDTNYENKFSTYAYSYIVGEITKYIRENKSIKQNRDLIRLGKKINQYIEKHKSVRNYEPSTKQIADMLNIKEEKVITALESLKMVKSLDQIITSDGKDIALIDLVEKKEDINYDTLLDLKEALKGLNDEERNIVIDRYYNDLTQSEVAKKIGVNQVYVSRLEKKVLSKMKNKMRVNL